MLEKAGEELAEVLKDVELSPLKVPYVTNVTAEQVSDIGMTRDLLAKQVSSSVEIGPGKTLAGFMRKISRDVKVYNIGTWDDVEKVVENLK